MGPCDVAVGAAFGTAKSGIGISGLGTFRPELIMKVRAAEMDVDGSVHIGFG
jgi:hypothetical protein